MHSFHPIKISLMLLSIYLLPFSAQATLVSTSLQGIVTLDNGGDNPFGLTNGDSVNASATYDDGLVVGADPGEEIKINGLSGWDFTITLGSFSFSQDDVTDPSFTSFFFDTGRLDGIRFFIEPIDIGLFTDLLLEDFDGGGKLFVEKSITADPVYLELDWDFVNATPPAAVPLPGVLWLFISGLISLFGAQKILKNSSLQG